MPPKFADSIAWQQAELLMQPAFIRVIDHIGKQLERSPWKGTYQDIQIWSEDVPITVQAQVRELQQQLVDATSAAAGKIEQMLADLPHPIPGYELRLEYQDQQISIELWDLCYQVCFDHYNPAASRLGDQPVMIDTALIDATGDVDWQHLNQKAKQLVEQIFTDLPSIENGHST
jgi:hypothetical protein